MELEARHFLALVRRGWWLLILGPLIAGLVGYSISSRAEPVYSSRVLIQINPPQAGGSFDPDALQSSESLATTYHQLIWTQPVLDPVIQKLSLPYDFSGLEERLTAWPLRGTQLIEVKASDSDPQRAADIANAVAESLSTYITDQSILLGNPTRSEIDTQLATTSEQIDQLQQQVVALEQSPSAEDAVNQEQVSQLRTTIVQLQQTHSELLILQQNMAINAVAAQTQITIASPAEPATTPDEPRPQLALMFGGAFGLFIAGTVVVVLGYLDNTVKASTDFPALVGAPLIGRIGSQPKLREGEGQLFMLNRPNEAVSEAIRLLRTNIEFASTAHKISSLAIASPSMGEGKSTVVANLAVATAQAGMRTVLIDADLRSPSQHRMFGVRNTLGLSSWLMRTDRPWTDFAASTMVANLLVIPSGPVPPNPADLLSLGRLRRLLDNIGSDADIILMDTSPVLGSSDALLVAAEVDGVILVGQSQRTRLDALRRAAAALQPSAVRMIGVVLNHQSKRRIKVGSYGTYDPAASLDKIDRQPSASQRIPHPLN